MTLGRSCAILGLAALAACTGEGEHKKIVEEHPPAAEAAPAPKASAPAPAAAQKAQDAAAPAAAATAGGSFHPQVTPLPGDPSAYAPLPGFQNMDIPADNPLTPEKAALGRQLYYDPRLSGD